MYELDYKKRTIHHQSPQRAGPYASEMATLGMRIRKAVSEGYILPKEESSYTSGHNGPSDYRFHNSSDPYNDSQHSVTGNGKAVTGHPLRAQFPEHISAVPDLTSFGSTAGSDSDLSTWNNHFVPNAPAMVNIGSDIVPLNRKRRHSNHQAEPEIADDMEDRIFQKKYGELRFDEDF